MTLPSFLAASISSGEPKGSCAVAVPPAAMSPAVSTAAPKMRLANDTIMRFNSLIACCDILAGAAHAGFGAACTAREQIGDADHHGKEHHLYQAESGGDADIAALVVVEQQHGHHHGVARIQEQ